jgi:uncharacterized RDD family membrane protein YckC
VTDNLSNPISDGSVVFADRDYAGLFRRIVIVFVDAVVIVLAGIFLIAVWVMVSDPRDAQEPPPEYWFTWLAIAYVYMVILKRSRLRTLGFWFAGVRIVDHSGQPPSVLRMTFRFLLLILGPIHPIIDLFWLGGDRHRQTLRDKFAGTYVVNRTARPAGPGIRKSAYYNFMAATLIFTEIHAADECAATVSAETLP